MTQEEALKNLAQRVTNARGRLERKRLATLAPAAAKLCLESWETIEWPEGMAQPSKLQLENAIALTFFPTIIEWAIEWASYQVVIHECGPNTWQVITLDGTSWIGGPEGDRPITEGAAAIEKAMRAIVIMLSRENFSHSAIDMKAVFQAIDKYCEEHHRTSVPTPRALVRAGLNGVGLSAYVQ